MNKHTANIFVGTPFGMILRNQGAKTILFTGIATEFGVETSARDAMARGFFSVVVSDAVSSYNSESHNRSLENMKNLVITASTDELCRIYEAK